MAESSSYHATNTTNSNKLSLAVDSIAARTTSETLRISSEAALPSSFILRPTAMTTTTPSNFQLPTSTTTNTSLNESQITTRKKSTSFQITSVVSSHASNDGADDSADDMDDSHAEDGSDMGDNNSSKCAETPSASCSEDAYSKSEEGSGITPFIQVTPVANLNDSDSVFAASDYQLQQQIARTLSSVSPSALAPPITPSSSSPSSNANNEGSKATFSEAEKDQQQWQTRFKVVKIESQEPFKRGRWLCMDFLDHPSMQTSLSRDESASNNSSNASSVHYVPGENLIAEHPLGHAVEEQILPGVVPQQLLPQQQITVPPLATVPNSIVVPQPMLQPNFLPNPTSTPLVHYPNPEPPNYASQAAPPTYPVPPQQQVPNPTMAVPRPVGLPTASYPVSNTGTYIQTVYTPAPNSQIPPNYPALVLQQPVVSNQPPNAVYPAGGTTLPTQTHYAQGPVSQPAAQAQGMYPSPAQQHFVNPAAAAVAPAPVVQPQPASAPTYQQPQQPYPAQTAFAPAQSSPATFAAYGAPPTVPASYAGPSVAQQYQSVPPNPSAGSTYAQPNTQVYNVPQPTAQQPYVPPPNAAPSYATAVASTPVQAQFVGPAPTAPQATVSLVTGQPAVNANPEAGAATTPKIVLPVATAPAPQTQPLLLGSGTSTSTSSVTSTNTAGPPTAAHAHFASLLPANIMGDEGTSTSGDDPNSTAGSTVAIDNKIEQAMDLVKSHLMYAVREEVEVLKERIAELLDRISVLESENSILKAAAPQEVLAELSTEIEDQHYSQQSSPAPPPQGPPSSTNN